MARPNIKYLESTYYFDFQSGVIQDIVSEFKENSISPKEKAVGLYRKVRDQWKYDPYSITLKSENYRSSHIACKPSGNCVEKSIVLISCLRAVDVPARLHLGKVKNHIAVERLTEKFGSNELTPHGMVQAHLNGKWLKMSPAFNASLCDRFDVEPLEFDGENSSFLQQFNRGGSLFMEYVDDYGHFEDVPLDFMKKNIKEHYPHIFDRDDAITEFKL